MKQIENAYIDFSHVIDYFSKDTVTNRIAQIYEEMQAFLKSNSLEDICMINDVALTHAVLDYFSSIRQLKEYQHIEHVNEVKIKAYETSWLLQRKPIQLTAQLEDDTWLYVNEKFNLLRLSCFLLQDDLTIPLVGDKKIAVTNFLDTLYYHLKFNNVSPQTMELVLLSFIAGRSLTVAESKES